MTKHCHQRDIKDIFPSGTKNRQVPSYYFRNIIVSDEHRLLYCYVPKVACSNWKRVLLVLNGDATDPWKVNTADVHNRTLGLFRYLNEYTPDEIVHRLYTYTKFLFVRHPFERLISAYRNKFIDSYNLTFFKGLYGRYIIKHYRKNPDALSLRTGEGVSFTEFVKFILNSPAETADRHWRRYDALCHPCLIYYDYIGKFENLVSDSSNLLKLLQVDDKVQFPYNKTSSYSVPTTVLAKEIFKELPSDLKMKLYNFYRDDFKMFGYSKEEYL